ncbi:hypothetical protein GCM10010844_25700 [Deinococcus radiotolerans]|uniref:Uncharacterized protein n=1 Tax=Deinococcus radiotolerans TaxID=1309407 RepID=A0ABQ2FLK4_9DEIO|nr:hypothetical protein GCM10010844_25700 [Deinococcus radiotolerans]
MPRVAQQRQTTGQERVHDLHDQEPAREQQRQHQLPRVRIRAVVVVMPALTGRRTAMVMLIVPVFMRCVVVVGGTARHDPRVAPADPRQMRPPFM